MAKIRIYSDKGVSPTALKHASKCFSFFDQVETIDSKEIRSTEWLTSTRLLIMPGGMDLFYVRKLNGAGNDLIRDYVQNGGSYLGLCAGAYYASRRIEFDSGGTSEVVGDRELPFFSGKAKGPLFPYRSSNYSGARVLTIDCLHLGHLDLFYNGGCYFDSLEPIPGRSVLGWYRNLDRLGDQPSIIKTDYGRGRVVLSGIHLEYDPYLLIQEWREEDIFLKSELSRLVLSDRGRKKLIKSLVDYLL